MKTKLSFFGMITVLLAGTAVLSCNGGSDRPADLLDLSGMDTTVRPQDDFGLKGWVCTFSLFFPSS